MNPRSFRLQSPLFGRPKGLIVIGASRIRESMLEKERGVQGGDPAPSENETREGVAVLTC